jgi:hypothetical protein
VLHKHQNAQAGDQATHQVAHHAVQRLPNGQFPKGISGNPSGIAGRDIRPAREARKAELYAAILKDVGGGPLSALEDAFALEAARQLARASTSDDDALSVRLVNAAAKLVERIKQSIAARNAGPKQTAFDRYVAEKYAQR